MVEANLDPKQLDMCTGQRWMKARRPSLYGPLTEPTGREQATRTVRFERPATVEQTRPTQQRSTQQSAASDTDKLSR